MFCFCLCLPVTGLCNSVPVSCCLQVLKISVFYRAPNHQFIIPDSTLLAKGLELGSAVINSSLLVSSPTKTVRLIAFLMEANADFSDSWKCCHLFLAFLKGSTHHLLRSMVSVHFLQQEFEWMYIELFPVSCREYINMVLLTVLNQNQLKSVCG